MRIYKDMSSHLFFLFAVFIFLGVGFCLRDPEESVLCVFSILRVGCGLVTPDHTCPHPILCIRMPIFISCIRILLCIVSVVQHCNFFDLDI